jgi:hypothetical protein
MTEESRSRSDREPGQRVPAFVDVISARSSGRVSRRPDAPSPPPSRGPGIRGGAVAGVASGLISGLCIAFWTAARGAELWRAAKMASAPFFGERSLQPAFEAGPVLVGTVAHLAVCTAWGALFGGVFYGATRGATVALGALWGLVAWLAMYYGVLPLVGVANLASVVPVALSIVAHVLFGLLLGIAFLPFQRVRRPLDWTL